MLVVDDGLGDGLQTPNDQFLNLLVALIHAVRPKPTHQVQLHTSKIPFTSELIIVIIRSFLDGYVGQVHECVGKVIQIITIPRVGKSAEAFSVEVDGQWLVADHKYINSKIELFTANQKRVHHISLDDVWLCLRTFWLPSQLILPLGNVLQLVEEENTFALTLSNWLHDPNLARPFEFLNK